MNDLFVCKIRNIVMLLIILAILFINLIIIGITHNKLKNIIKLYNGILVSFLTIVSMEISNNYTNMHIQEFIGSSFLALSIRSLLRLQSKSLELNSISLFNISVGYTLIRSNSYIRIFTCLEIISIVNIFLYKYKVYVKNVNTMYHIFRYYIRSAFTGLLFFNVMVINYLAFNTYRIDVIYEKVRHYFYNMPTQCVQLTIIVVLSYKRRRGTGLYWVKNIYFNLKLESLKIALTIGKLVNVALILKLAIHYELLINTKLYKEAVLIYILIGMAYSIAKRVKSYKEPKAMLIYNSILSLNTIYFLIILFGPSIIIKYLVMYLIIYIAFTIYFTEFTIKINKNKCKSMYFIRLITNLPPSILFINKIYRMAGIRSQSYISIRLIVVFISLQAILLNAIVSALQINIKNQNIKISNKLNIKSKYIILFISFIIIAINTPYSILFIA